MQPRRHRRADVCAHDDVDGLPQRHQPRVYKANDHDRRGRRALNDRRHAKPCQKARSRLARHFAEQRAELSARTALKRLSHQAHAEQKQAQPADHRQYVKNIHLHFFLSHPLYSSISLSEVCQMQKCTFVKSRLSPSVKTPPARLRRGLSLLLHGLLSVREVVGMTGVVCHLIAGGDKVHKPVCSRGRRDAAKRTHDDGARRDGKIGLERQDNAASEAGA